jgi:hypothetical protein
VHSNFGSISDCQNGMVSIKSGGNLENNAIGEPLPGELVYELLAQLWMTISTEPLGPSLITGKFPDPLHLAVAPVACCCHLSISSSILSSRVIGLPASDRQPRWSEGLHTKRPREISRGHSSSAGRSFRASSITLYRFSGSGYVH